MPQLHDMGHRNVCYRHNVNTTFFPLTSKCDLDLGAKDLGLATHRLMTVNISAKVISKSIQE